jgi:hypothetical protein
LCIQYVDRARLKQAVKSPRIEEQSGKLGQKVATGVFPLLVVNMPDRMGEVGKQFLHIVIRVTTYTSREFLDLRVNQNR